MMNQTMIVKLMKMKMRKKKLANSLMKKKMILPRGKTPFH